MPSLLSPESVSGRFRCHGTVLFREKTPVALSVSATGFRVSSAFDVQRGGLTSKPEAGRQFDKVDVVGRPRRFDDVAGEEMRIDRC